MENVVYHLQNEILTLTIDLTKDSGPSSSGKSNIIASTHGYATLDPENGIAFNLNVIQKKGKRK